MSRTGDAVRRGQAPGARSAAPEIVRAALEVIAERGYRGASLARGRRARGPDPAGAAALLPDQGGAAGRGAGGARPVGHGGGRAPRLAALDLLASLVEYNAMRPGIVQTFSALLGESVTEGHPAREFFTERYAQVRARAWRRCCAPSTATGSPRPHPGAGRAPAGRGHGRPPVPVAARPGVGGHAGGVPGLPRAARRGLTPAAPALPYSVSTSASGPARPRLRTAGPVRRRRPRSRPGPPA